MANQDEEGWVDAEPAQVSDDEGWVDAEPAPAAKAAPPVPAGPPSALDVVKQKLSGVGDSFNKAARTTLSGATLGTYPIVAPYLEAAADKILPIDGPTNYNDQVEKYKKEWQEGVDPSLANAVTGLVTGGSGLIKGFVQDGITNATQVASDYANRGKDILQPDNALDALQTTALMTTAPAALRELGRTVKSYVPEGLPGYIVSLANKASARAAGIRPEDLKKFVTAQGENAMETIGRVLRQKGLIKGGRSSEELLPGVETAIKESGGAMGSSLKEADSLTGGTGSQVRAQVADRKIADSNLRQAEREAENMYTDAAQTRAADDIGKRDAFKSGIVRRAEEAAKARAAERTALKDNTAEGLINDSFGRAHQRDSLKTKVSTEALDRASKYDALAAKHEERVLDELGDATQDARNRSLSTPLDNKNGVPLRDRALEARLQAQMQDRAWQIPDRPVPTGPLASVAPESRLEKAMELAKTAEREQLGVADPKTLVDTMADTDYAGRKALAAERAAAVEAERYGAKPPDLANAMVEAGPKAPALANEAAEVNAANKFGDRGTKEAFEKAGELPPDVKMDRIPAVPASEFTKDLGFDGLKFVDTAEQEIRPFLADPANAHLAPAFDRLLGLYRKKAARGLSFSDANELKTALQATVAKFRNSKGKDAMRVRLQGVLGDEIEEQVAPVLGETGTNEFLRNKADLKSLYPARAGLQRSAYNMDAANPFGLSEMLTGVASSTTGGPLGMIKGAAAGRLLRGRGMSTAASGLNKMADLMEGAPRTLPEGLAGASPALIRAIGPENVDAFIQWLEKKKNDDGPSK